MIDLMLNIRRRFWDEVSTDTVQDYLKNLIKFKDELKTIHFTYLHDLFGSNDLIKEIEELVDKEINLCSFYFDYQKRCESEPNFNQWVFKEKDDIEPKWGREAQGDQWVKTNGKIKATIQFDRSGKRVKISLSFMNDSAILNFMGRHVEKIKSVHLKNETSIARKVDEFKTKADTYLSDHEYPIYCAEKLNIEILNKLLHINGSAEKEE